ITQEQVVEDAHVTILTVAKETEVLDARFSHSSDLASRFLKFLDIHPNDAEIVSPLDVHVHHEVPRTYTSTLLTVPVSVIPEASPVCIIIPQSSQTFTSPLLQTTPTPPPTIGTTTTPSIILDFAYVLRFNDRINALEKDIAELKKDPLHTQVIALVDDHLDTRMGATREEFMSFFSATLTERIIEKMIEESLNQVNLAKVSSQPQLTYEVAATLTKFKLKKILIDKINENNDKDEGPSAGSDRGFKKRKTSKDAELTTGTKSKDSASGSSKAQNLNQNLLERMINQKYQNSRLQIQICLKIKEGIWNVGKTPQKGPTQNWLMTLAASSSTNKSLKSFDELMSTPIDISAYIMNGLKISNLTQETLLGPAFRLLKGTRSNYAELEYDFEECYKALLEKFDWENPEGGDYPFDLTKPLPLVKVRNCQKVPADYFFNNDIKYLQGGISTMTYTTSLTNTKAAHDDLPGIEDIRLKSP
nr:hypothetical protein [Tanacetum cinerariifolium]